MTISTLNGQLEIIIWFKVRDGDACKPGKVRIIYDQGFEKYTDSVDTLLEITEDGDGDTRVLSVNNFYETLENTKNSEKVQYFHHYLVFYYLGLYENFT